MTAVLTDPETLQENWHTGHPVDPARMRAVMGAFPTGVTVVTTMSGPRPVGMTISSFASVSLDPPLVLVCVARTAASLPAFRVGRPLAVNVLGHGQAHLARRFASRVEDRFEGVDHRPGRNGSPLLSGTAAWVQGHVQQIHDAGDHVLLLVNVQRLHRSEIQPLLYHSGLLHDWEPPTPEDFR
ncbi:flavin reductase family protein [Luteococcus sp. Sow4_B9]|uniref:flavin reductase family protein n=1 Tax=Luteococcus sp. Sow4_B9 TaxID=3438792 RepID=UPI003F992751